jgi:DNA-binding transcriptional ArsR family regulator
MPESGRGSPKKGSRKGGEANGRGGGKAYSESDLIRGLNHPLRRQALRLLHRSKRPMSPVQIEAKLKLGKEPKEQLSQIGYHITTLAGYGLISNVGERQVRGAMEHFYRSNVSRVALVRQLLESTREADEARPCPQGRE